MKIHFIFPALLACFLAGCDSPHPNNFDILFKWVIPGTFYTGYDSVKTGLMKHVYAAPGTSYPEFEAEIEAVEKINQVPAVPDAGPHFAADHVYLFQYEGRKAVYYGRFTKQPDSAESVAAFSAGEITNLAAFVAKLKTPTDPVSAFLRGRFSESTRQAIARFPEPDMDGTNLEPVLLNELNAIIDGPSIYEADRFGGAELSRASLVLLKFERNTRPETRLRREQMLVVLNRMLLADAYPANLPMKPWVPMRNYVAIKY
jgi:hypothetical protein